MAVGLATRVAEEAREPICISTVDAVAPPELASIVAVPTCPVPRIVVRATPLSSVSATSGSRAPRVVEKLTGVPGLTAVPLSRLRIAVTDASPVTSMREGLTLKLIVVPAGATGEALSQPGDTATSKRITQAVRA
jgi:hypothetical protein